MASVESQPTTFVAHGSSRLESRGQVLILHSAGPFNAEHIRSLAEPFRSWAAKLQPGGAWATINVVRHSAMCTPEAIEALRLSAERSRQHLGRVAAAYVITPEVEGRRLMEPALRGSCAGIMPMEIFADLASALAWAEAQVASANGLSGPGPTA